MPIGHLYWYALSFLLCGLYAQSHFDAWPGNGYGPHKGFKNRYHNDPDVKAATAARKKANDLDKYHEAVSHIVAEYEKEKKKAERKRSKKRGESDDERERRRRRREDEIERALQSSQREVQREARKYEQRQQEAAEEGRDETLERARERARRRSASGSAGVGRGGESTRSTARKRKRSGSGDRRDRSEVENEKTGDPHPRKRVGLLQPQNAGASGEDAQQDDTLSNATVAATESHSKQTEAEGKVKITIDSNGLPQISTGFAKDDQQQDALLIGGQYLPPRPSSAHASDHDFNTPLPAAVREDLFGTSKATSRASTPTKKPFSLLMAFCRDNDLLLTLISYLPIPSLISLYAISKTFHHLFNRHHTAFILSSMRSWAPNADTIYPWRCYKSLCTSDPQLRQKMRYQGLDQEEAVFRLGKRGKDLRDVPSFRWLQMVVWRQGVCKDMLVMLATKGLRCPPGTLDAVKRIWFILDLPLNSQRIALIQNPSYIPSHTIYAITLFLLKVDMAFTLPDQAAYPAHHPGMPAHWAHNIPTGVPLRKLLLAERHLTSLWRVLRGWTWDPSQPRIPMTNLEALRLWVRHKFRLPEDAPQDVKEMSIMGMPWWEIGTAGLERTGVAFFNLGGKTVPVTHPAIMSREATATHRGRQLLYPHRRVIHLPSVLEKPREPLLRPDELLLKEGVRRQMSMHTEWVHMMLWGFTDEVGFNWPVFREEDYRSMDRGIGVVEVMQEKVRVLRAKARAETQKEVETEHEKQEAAKATGSAAVDLEQD